MENADLRPITETDLLQQQVWSERNCDLGDFPATGSGRHARGAVGAIANEIFVSPSGVELASSANDQVNSATVNSDTDLN